MSLILAEVSNDFGWFVGDTLLTGIPDERLATVNGDYHALKIHIINDKICIALAGKYDLGLLTINETTVAIGKNSAIDESLIDKICSTYLEICCRENFDFNACEFLVMLILPTKNILAKISHGAFSICQRSYIGDSEFYKRLQGKRTPYVAPNVRSVQQPDGSFIEEAYECPDIEKNFMEITDAMRKISGKAIDSTVGVIGDNVVRIGINRQNVFEYFQNVERGVSNEEGQFGNTLLSSTSPKHGIGIYYYKGYGYLFISGDNAGCRKVEAKTLDDFINKSKAYSLELVGGTWS